MDSKFNIDGKMSADAMRRETNNLNSNATNENPVFKDQKRVIKKMIVMDTSKLKALGIEATIKNAMSKLEKGNRKMQEHPIFKHPHVRPIFASSKLLNTVVKSEFEPKIASDNVMKHQIQPGMTAKLPVRSSSVSPKSSTHHNVHHIRSPAPSTATLVKSSTPSTATLVKSSTPSTATLVKSSTPSTATLVKSSTPSTATLVKSSTPSTATLVKSSTPSTATLVKSSTPSTATLVKSSTPSTATLVKSSTPSTATLVKSSTPSTATLVKSSTPSTATLVKSSTPSTTTLVKSSTPSTATLVKSSTPSTATLVKSSTPSTATLVKSSTPSTATLVKSSTASTATLVKSSTPSTATLVKSSTPSTATLVKSSTPSTATLVKSSTPPVPVVRKVASVTAVPSNSTNRAYPIIVPSMPTKPTKVEQTSGSTQNNLENSKRWTSEVVHPATTKCTTDNPIIKTESTVASDGKKIKILSDVSLNDTKAKLLEIDKLSSKNLKFTNVIKGTDKSPSKPTVHVADNPVIPPYSRPAHFKPQFDKVSHTKYTDVIKGTDPGQSRSTNFTSQHQTTTAKPLKIEIKNLNLGNAADGMDKSKAKVTFHVGNTVKRPARSLSTSSISARSEDNRPAAKNLKYANVMEGIDQRKYTTQPFSCSSSTSVKTGNKTFSSKTFNSYNVTEGIPSRSTVHTSISSTNQHASPSYPSPKNVRPGTNTISSKNVNFAYANTWKPPINFSTSSPKPVPVYLPTGPPNRKWEEIRRNHSNVPNVKSTREPPMTVRTPTFKAKPTASTSAEGSAKKLASSDENIEIIMPSKQKYLTRKRRTCIDEPTPIIDPTKSLHDVLWDTNNLRTYRRHNINRLLSDKIIKKSRSKEEVVQNIMCTVENEQAIGTVPVEANELPTDTTPGECDSISKNVMSVESKPICDQPVVVTTPSLQPAEVELKVVQSETVSKNNFRGFTIEEVNASASLLNRIKVLVSRKSSGLAKKEEMIGTVDCENDQWVLNYETGVLEKRIDKDVTAAVLQQDVGLTTTDNDGTPVNELNPSNENPPTTQVLEAPSKVLLEPQINSPVFDISPTPTKIPVIEDADDEISDIDLVHRSKAKCTGSTITPAVKNRRAILKSIELHRKAFMPATTDDESELSLCVRPPRPKLRKSRQKQTVEQLKIQQNAHVSLLRRFTQTAVDCDNLNDEDLVYFIDGMMDRIEVLENQVKCCFNSENPSELNVDSIPLSEPSASTIDTVIEKNESVKSSEKVTEYNELVTPSESSSNVNTSINCVAASEDHSTLPDNAETAGDGEGQSMIQEVTIQKDTFLVVEYNDHCDKINHVPIAVKLEKETSPKPSCSINRNRVTKPKTILKKRNRKSLVEMLAQHVDQDTLKSVIIAHANQKCDFSSSPDSDSEDDSDERGDVISKIFRTVCTIDLCDDDDETLHEDVLQYIYEENEIENALNAAPCGPANADQLNSNIDPPNPVQHPLGEELKPVKATPETLEPLIKISDTKSAANPKVCEDSEPSKEVVISSSVRTVSTSAKFDDITKKSQDSAEIQSEAARTGTHTEVTSSSPLEISNVLFMETESNIVKSSGDLEVLDESVSSAHQTINISKSDSIEEIDISNTVQSRQIYQEPDEITTTSQQPDEIATTSQLSVENVSEVITPDLHNEMKISLPLVISSITKESQISAKIVSETIRTSPRKEISSASPSVAPNVVETESNNVTTLYHTKMLNAVVVVGKCEASQTSNRSKSEDAITVPKDFKKTALKLKPFDEISSRANPKNAENETLVNSNICKMLSFEETLTKTDSEISEGKRKVSTKGKDKVQRNKSVGVIEHSITENPIDANQNNSRLHVKSLKNETAIKDAEKPSSNKLRLSETSTADPTKIGKNLQEPKLDCNNLILLSNSEIQNESKPNRSRKRKSQVSQIPATTTPIRSESTRKRPIFEYFDSPEILPTKRARKSKSYVDDEIQNEEVPTTTKPPSQRTSKRKLNNSKSTMENDEMKSESKVRKFVEKASKEPLEDVPPTEPLEDVPPTEPLEDVTEPTVEDNIELPSSTVPKTGRGIKQPKLILAPQKVADKYDCGNCKEEVLAKNWTKHIRIHYGLAWRVGVDEAIDLKMDIQKLASKVLNYTKKANIRNLKCHKCNDEKKSALGYISHIELCGLTPEEMKSKKLKCEYCPSIVRSCSMSSHLKYCSGLKRLMQKESESNQKDVDSLEECFNDAGRAVRRSAQKAMSSFKDLNKPLEAKIEDYVERAHKISNKQHRKWRQQLKQNCTIECVRNGCQFTSDDIGSMLDHFNTCVLVDGETFYCNRCEHGPDARTVIEEHIKANHSLGVIKAIDAKDFSDSEDEAEVGEESSESDGESGDDESLGKEDDEHDDEFDDYDDDDGWNTKGYKNKRQREWPHNDVMINNCLDRKVLSDHATLLKTYSGGSYFQPTVEWTQDFRDKHFSNEDLFPFATPNSFSVLNSTLTDLYTPKVSISNKFFVKEVSKYKRHHGSTKVDKSDVWKSLKRFEAIKENNTIVLFAGGPVLSMAWLPVPDDNLSQILAVCCRSDPTEDILLNNTQPMKCLIQIWNFNKLKNGQLPQAQSPHLLYSVAYDHGPVIQMEFCPSGGFTEDRLGLLAVSSYDGHVDILSLPKNFTRDNSKNENSFFIIPPSMTLCCELEKPLNVLLTKLVWSQSKGHTKLAGGFANGLVAIWNLNNFESSHNCSKIDDVFTILPTHLFLAGKTTIKLLEFHHDEKNEARWIVAGTHDRKVKFFDTHNVSIEISSMKAHSRIAAGCWPIHWSAFLFGVDNAYTLKVSGILVKQPLDIGSRTGTFYSCIGSTCDISFNNWLNSYVFVTSYGDIHVGYVPQMISGYTETRRQRSILGYTDSVDINQSNSTESDVTGDADRLSAFDEPSTSSACTLVQANDNLYPSADGIIFCDFDNPLPAVTSPSYAAIRGPPMDKYNMVKVNRVLFNPNVSAYKLYAIGYECGFVRINQLLPK